MTRKIDFEIFRHLKMFWRLLMLRNVPLSKEVAQIIHVLTVENANLSLKMIMNVFVVKNLGKTLF